MPKMPIRKAKRVSVLTKRTQRWRNLYKEMISNTQLYEKLKINNGYLAKALSKEKQNLLLIKNVEPTGETVASQQLHLLCNVQNNVISNVLDDAKVIQKMLTPIIDQMTSTINMRQELIDSNHSTTMRLSSASAGRKKSSNKLSTKSATGVVKPTVDGKTITKTTINSSLVNTENINNTSRLSDLQEVTLPNTSEEINETRSPIKPSTSLRHESGTCRMLEGLTISLPKVNVADEQISRRKRKRSHHSRLSVSCSPPRNRLSKIDETPTTTGHINVIGTRIDIETQESNDLSAGVNTRAELQVLINSSEEDETHVHTSKKDTISMRQELVESNYSTTVRLSSASAGRKKSSNKLSTKSATGVVQPTVDGKTITKTTINSSLVNTENINNTSRLSDLQEVTLPNTSEEINETRSPIKPSTSLRHRKNKVQLNSIFTVSCSQPENRRSEIDKAPTTTGHINVIGTRIDIETQESNKDIPPDVSDKLTTRLESQVLINSSEKDEIHVNTSKKIQWINTWNSREGASWMNMHNNTMSSRSYEPDSDISQVLSDDTRDNELDSDTSQVMSDDSSVTESDIEDAENRTRHSKYKALRRDMKNQINEMKADYKKEINDLKIRLEQALITTVRQYCQTEWETLENSELFSLCDAYIHTIIN